MSGDGIVTTAVDHGLPLLGEIGPQDAAMLRILLALHQSAPLQGGQRQLDALRADQQSAGQIGPGQSWLGRKLTHHAVWAVVTPCC